MDAAEGFYESAEMALDGTREVVLDMADLAFLDSAGVRAILRLAGSCPNGLVLHRLSWSFLSRLSASMVPPIPY